MRICIATGNYYEAGETQVNHHIASLFNGNTIVLSRKSNGIDPIGKPMHVWHLRPKGVGALSHYASLVWRMACQQSTKVASRYETREICAFLQAEKAEVVLAEFGHHALPVYRAAMITGLPFYVYFRGADASKHLRKRGRASSYRKMMKRAAGVFAVSQFLLDELAARGVAHENAHVIPSGVDTQRVKPCSKVSGRYLFVGRFVHKKQPLLALEAFSKVAASKPTAHFRMIGAGELHAACLARAAELGLKDRVTFLGHIDHKEVQSEMANAEFILVPSKTAENGDTEGLPMVLQEAMAAGAIVVATDHAGIPEALQDGMTGFVAPESDPSAFCSAVVAAAMLSEQELAEMRHQARAFAVQHLDQATLTAKLEEKIRLGPPRTGPS
jgi:glycosyltransferase involved in cell wall biosynthesis